MDLHLWLAFVAASVVILVIPGPTVMLVAGYALSRGFRQAWKTALGVALGDATAMSCSLLGLGALLRAGSDVFTVLRLCGAAYLVWLGLKMWRAAPVLAAPGREPEAPAPGGTGRMIAHAWVVTALNPKSIVFFIAFVPQFISADHPAGPQMLALLCTFVPLAFANAAAYAFLASSFRRAAARPEVLRAANRAGGAMLLGAGLWTALRRT